MSAGVYRHLHSKRQLGAPALALAGRRTDAQIDRQTYSAVPGRRNWVVATLALALGQFLGRLQELSWFLAIIGTRFQTRANSAKSRHKGATLCRYSLQGFFLKRGKGGAGGFDPMFNHRWGAPGSVIFTPRVAYTEVGRHWYGCHSGEGWKR